MRRWVAVAAVAVAVASGFAAASRATAATSSVRGAQARLSDFPVGWRTASNEEGERSKCLPTQKAPVKSQRNFAHGDSDSAATYVAVYPAVAAARRVFAIAASDRAWQCLADELKKESDAKSVDQGRILLRRVGATVAARELVLTVEEQGVRASGYVHFAIARKGRALVALITLGVFDPALTISEESLILRRMVARL